MDLPGVYSTESILYKNFDHEILETYHIIQVDVLNFQEIKKKPTTTQTTAINNIKGYKIEDCPFEVNWDKEIENNE